MHMWNSFSWTEFESIFINPKRRIYIVFNHTHTSLYLKTSKHLISYTALGQYMPPGAIYAPWGHICPLRPYMVPGAIYMTPGATYIHT